MNKFYMNNPCEIVRKINDDFSEIVVYPKFADSMEGSQWCTACMVGGMDGAHPSHTCEPYQDVIEAINDSEASMLIVVENRLLQDKPVEFAKWSEAITQIKEINSDILNKKKLVSDIKRSGLNIRNRNLIKSKEIDLKSAKIADLDRNICELEAEIIGLRRSLGTAKGLVSVGSVTLSMSVDELKAMIKDSLVLEKLQAGGVDNWEWYGDTLGDFDAEAETDKFIESMKIESIT